MKNLILVSKTPIVIQIFKLITKKLNLKLEVLGEAQIDHKVDIIIVDKEFIDDRFNILKTYSKFMGAITNEELPFEIANDFTIPLPFLPSSLQTILEIQVEELKKRANAKTYITNIERDINDIPTDDYSEDIDELDPALHYLDSLASGIANDIDEDNDDSLVSLDTVNSTGGILDLNELSKLEKIIDPDSINTSIQNNNVTSQQSTESKDNEWQDLSSIIDQAIYEVNSSNDYYEKDDSAPIQVILNNYSLEELSPLLNLLNQDIIDELTSGSEIDLKLRLGEVNV